MTENVPSVELRLSEAVELCTAWIHAASSERGIRLLVIKGATLSLQGLREPHPSSDVDVLIDPAHFADVQELVVQAGWSEFAESFASERFTLHSRTYTRDGWPNSIDLHLYWPGFLKPADEVFEVLWERRERVDFAHQLCNVPDRTANLLMLALHSLRGRAAQTRHRIELQGLLRLQLSEGELQDIATLVVATGCVAPLRNVLPPLGVEVAVVDAELRTPEYVEWHRKVAEQEGRVASWLIMLKMAPWREKVVLARHGLWPRDRDLLVEHPDVPDRFAAKLWARFKRLGRGLGQLPRVIPAVRRH